MKENKNQLKDIAGSIFSDADPKKKPEVEPEKLPGEDPGVAPEPDPDEEDDDDDTPYLEPSIGDDPDEIGKKTTIF